MHIYCRAAKCQSYFDVKLMKFYSLNTFIFHLSGASKNSDPLDGMVLPTANKKSSSRLQIPEEVIDLSGTYSSVILTITKELKDSLRSTINKRFAQIKRDTRDGAKLADLAIDLMQCVDTLRVIFNKYDNELHHRPLQCIRTTHLILELMKCIATSINHIGTSVDSANDKAHFQFPDQYFVRSG